MRILTVLVLALVSLAAAWVLLANDAPKTNLPTSETPAKTPAPRQLVTFQEPANFTTVFEQPSAEAYIRKSVPKGETADRWTEMIMVTGTKEAADEKRTAQYFAAQSAAEFQKACPATFSVKPLGATKVSGQDAFAAVASCGKIDASGGNESETALILAIKAAAAVYTVRWIERTAANAENLTIDESKWKGRLAKLAPIRLCTVKPGEKAPYPNCSEK